MGNLWIQHLKISLTLTWISTRKIWLLYFVYILFWSLELIVCNFLVVLTTAVTGLWTYSLERLSCYNESRGSYFLCLPLQRWSTIHLLLKWQTAKVRTLMKIGLRHLNVTMDSFYINHLIGGYITLQFHFTYLSWAQK